MDGLDGLATRGKFVQDGDVQVAVERHGQRARDGRSRHHEDVRRQLGLVPKPRALLHTEAVLLVNHGEAQVLELYFVFNQRVRAEDDVDGTVFEARVNAAALGSLGVSGQQGNLHTRVFQVFEDAVVVLDRQNFRGGHDTGLVTVVHRHHRREDGHQRLSATHVALQQAVHLAAAAHVITDFVQDAFLGIGERERNVAVSLVESRTYTFKYGSGGTPHADVLLLEHRQLQEEEFFELEPFLRLGQRLDILRKMDVLQRESQRTEMPLEQQVFGQRFVDPRKHFREQGGLQFGDDLVAQPAAAEFLGAVVDAQEMARVLLEFLLGGQVHLGMDQIVFVVEDARLSENDILAAHFQLVLHPLDPRKKDEVDGAGPVGEGGHQPLAFLGAYHLDRRNMPAQLDIGVGGVDFTYRIELGSIDIAERKRVEHVAESVDAQLFLQ